jgi:CRISPR/Cas system-associated endonuclease/helicase Cas3
MTKEELEAALSEAIEENEELLLLIQLQDDLLKQSFAANELLRDLARLQDRAIDEFSLVRHIQPLVDHGILKTGR